MVVITITIMLTKNMECLMDYYQITPEKVITIIAEIIIVSIHQIYFIVHQSSNCSYNFTAIKTVNFINVKAIIKCSLVVIKETFITCIQVNGLIYSSFNYYPQFAIVALFLLLIFTGSIIPFQFFKFMKL